MVLEPMEAQSVLLYADCHHSRWHKLRYDWSRFRRHPATHVVSYSKLYAAYARSQLGVVIDFDQDTIKVGWDKDGIFKVE